jgi:hypothetical protein
MKLCKKIGSCLQEFDFFGSPINFHINGSPEYTSCLGGCMFIIYSSVAIAYLIYNFMSFCSRESMSLISTYKITDSPELINLSETNFSFAFGILYDVNNSNAIETIPKYFDYKLSLTSIYNITKKVKVSIPFTKCTKDYFSSVDNETYNSLQISSMMCPSKEFRKNMTLVGKFGDIVFNYIQISISLKPEFLNQTSIISNFLSTTPLKSIIFYQDTSVSYDEYEKPLNKFINSFFNYIDINKLLKSDIYFAKMEFGSDSNIILPDMKTSYNSIFESYREYFYPIYDRFAVSKSNGDYLDIAKFYIRSSTKYIIYERTYQKITDFIANMTGILSQGMIVIWVVVSSINQNLSYKHLINKTMRYKDSKKFNIGKMSQYYKQILERKNNNQIESNQSKIFSSDYKNEEIPVEIELSKDNKNKSGCISSHTSQYFNQTSIKNLNDPDTLKKLPKKFAEFKKENYPKDSKECSERLPAINSEKNLKIETLKKKEVELSSFEVNFYKFCPCFQKRKREAKINSLIMKTGEERIIYSLDALVYLKKMQEIDVLKYILLSDAEKKVFNFLSHPLIVLDENKSNIYKEFFITSINLENDSERAIEELMINYEKLSKKQKQSTQEEILLKLFESEMESLVDK